MQRLTNNPRVILAAVLAWPVLVVGAAMLWPGPQALPAYAVSSSVGARPTAVPPVDSGTQLALNENGTARIFWAVPEDGVVQLTIEIDGNDDTVTVDAEEAEPDSAIEAETPDIEETG